MAEAEASDLCGHSHSQPFLGPGKGTIAAGSSSSPYEESKNFDVFLCHLGSDVGTGFVSNLYDALRSAGLNPFLEEKSVVKGVEDFLQVVFASITARVHVLVASEGYREYEFFLEYLHFFFGRRKLVIPVLYDVKRSWGSEMLRKVTGMAKRRSPFKSPLALEELANLSKFRLSGYKWDEEKLARKLVVVISNLNTLLRLEGDHISFLDRILRQYPTIREVTEEDILILRGSRSFQQTEEHYDTIVLGSLNIDTGNLEFYFECGESMAKVVGVGLQYGKAIVDPGFGFEVEEIKKEDWEKIWDRGKRSCLSSTMKIFKVKLSTGARAKVSQECASGVANSQVQVPFLCELSKFLIISTVVDEFYTKCGVQTYDIHAYSETFRVQCVQESSGRQSKTGGGSGTIDAWRSTLVGWLSTWRVDPQSHQKKQGGSGDGGDGSNDGDGRDGKDKAGSVSPKKEVITTKVSISLLPRRHDSLSRSELEQLRLKNVVIDPFLTLDFRKTIEASMDVTKEILCTIGSVHFCLDKESLKQSLEGFETCQRFGWFHDKLEVCFGPKSGNSQVSLLDESKVEDYMDCKATNKASSSKQTGVNHEAGGALKFVGGNNNVAKVEISGTVKRGKQSSDTQGVEQSQEFSCKQTEGGFDIEPNRQPLEARYVYRYRVPSKFGIVEQERIEELSYRSKLFDSPLCRDQSTKFSCSWYVQGSAVVDEFEFKASRDLREIQETIVESQSSSSTSTSSSIFKRRRWKTFGESGKEKPGVKTHVERQEYKKDILINLAMSHLEDGDRFVLVEGPYFQEHNWRQDVPLVQFS